MWVVLCPGKEVAPAGSMLLQNHERASVVGRGLESGVWTGSWGLGCRMVCTSEQVERAASFKGFVDGLGLSQYLEEGYGGEAREVCEGWCV